MPPDDAPPDPDPPDAEDLWTTVMLRWLAPTEPPPPEPSAEPAEMPAPLLDPSLSWWLLG